MKLNVVKLLLQNRSEINTLRNPYFEAKSFFLEKVIELPLTEFRNDFFNLLISKLDKKLNVKT